MLPISRHVPADRLGQRRPKHGLRLLPEVDAAIILSPGDVGRIPIKILACDVVMDADFGPTQAGEVALDLVGAGIRVYDESDGVVVLSDGVQSSQLVVGRVLVTMWKHIA